MAAQVSVRYVFQCHNHYCNYCLCCVLKCCGSPSVCMMLIASFNVIIIIVIIINAVYCNTVAAQMSVRCSLHFQCHSHYCNYYLCCVLQHCGSLSVCTMLTAPFNVIIIIVIIINAVYCNTVAAQMSVRCSLHFQCHSHYCNYYLCCVLQHCGSLSVCTMLTAPFNVIIIIVIIINAVYCNTVAAQMSVRCSLHFQCHSHYCNYYLCCVLQHCGSLSVCTMLTAPFNVIIIIVIIINAVYCNTVAAQMSVRCSLHFQCHSHYCNYYLCCVLQHCGSLSVCTMLTAPFNVIIIIVIIINAVCCNIVAAQVSV